MYYFIIALMSLKKNFEHFHFIGFKVVNLLSYYKGESIHEQNYYSTNIDIHVL